MAGEEGFWVARSGACIIATVDGGFSPQKRHAHFLGRTCVVTGGAGFIGTRLVERLIACGARRVLVLDDLRRPSLRALAALAAHPQVELRRIDLAGARDLARELAACDVLFHLAAEKHAVARRDPARALRANVLGTHRLLEAAARSRVAKVVFTSSLYAHGARNSDAMRESDRPQPDTVYGMSKLAGEYLLRRFETRGDLDCTALRLFFIYGEGQLHAGGRSVILDNFARMLRGHAPRLHGDGRQRLDYLYVDDAVEALLSAADPSARGELIHIGSGRGTSVLELTQRMLAIAGRDAQPCFDPPDETHGTCRVADISLARERLEWRPAVALEEGLRRVFDALRARGVKAA